MRKNNFNKKYFYGKTNGIKNPISGIEKYKNEIREKRERYEKDKQREKNEQREERKRNEIRKVFEYEAKIYGRMGINRRLSKMDSDEWEKYKAREYVRKENRNGHECYNGVKGEKLWINRERWKLLHK